jgi:hypothetical protein
VLRQTQQWLESRRVGYFIFWICKDLDFLAEPFSYFLGLRPQQGSIYFLKMVLGHPPPPFELLFLTHFTTYLQCGEENSTPYR